MVTSGDFLAAFRALGIEAGCPVVAHASLSAFGFVEGGAETVVGALLAGFHSVLMPTFTYKTMLVPETGPEDNGLLYGVWRDTNFLAEFFRPSMPADRLMGAVPEALRAHPKAGRSMHPILSFAGLHAGRALACQSLEEPLAPLRAAWEAGGWVLLLGVNHTVNTSIHLAEQLAGRKQFLRWALTPEGVVACPGFPGCSEGFDALAPSLRARTRQVQVGPTLVQAVPLADLVSIAFRTIASDPLALLCQRSYCERCQAVRAQVLELHTQKSPEGEGEKYDHFYHLPDL